MLRARIYHLNRTLTGMNLFLATSLYTTFYVAAKNMLPQQTFAQVASAFILPVFRVLIKRHMSKI